MTARSGDSVALQEHYRNLAEIERRASGARYSARLRHGTAVVVHALSPDFSAKVRHPDRFIATLERAASVTHPSLSPLLAWGRTLDGGFHCAYAASEGATFVPGSVSPSQVAELGVQICQALSTAHLAGFVHGGIQSAGITHSDADGVRLTDFGLFAALCEGGVSVDDALLAVGDVPYASPEQQDGNAPDPRSDVFSLGASLYELLTGKPPFGGRTTSFVMAAVLSETPTDSGVIFEDSNAVVDALLRAIERAPDDRWPTMDAFARALAAGARQSSTGERDRRRGWSRFLAIFRRAWFPTGRSRG